jgi:hypothetical protein
MIRKGIMTQNETKVVAAWNQAAKDLGIRFTSPFTINTPDGRTVEFLGFIHQFGRRLGTLITVLHEPSSSAKLSASDDYFTNDDYFSSVLGSIYGEYDRELFIATLDDWQFLGAETERPAWYSGKSWG